MTSMNVLDYRPGTGVHNSFNWIIHIMQLLINYELI